MKSKASKFQTDFPSVIFVYVDLLPDRTNTQFISNVTNKLLLSFYRSLSSAVSCLLLWNTIG